MSAKRELVGRCFWQILADNGRLLVVGWFFEVWRVDYARLHFSNR